MAPKKNKTQKKRSTKVNSAKSSTRKLLPKLKPVNYEGKKYHYKLKDPARTRRLALDEGIQTEIQRMGKTKRQAAIAKKGRLNILRIYRRYQNPKDCEKITRDMKYIDEKYNLGKTGAICGKKKRN
jgi:hypothetical protein